MRKPNGHLLTRSIPGHPITSACGTLADNMWFPTLSKEGQPCVMKNAGCKPEAAQLQQCQGKVADAPTTGTMPVHVVEVVDMGCALASGSIHLVGCGMGTKEGASRVSLRENTDGKALLPHGCVGTLVGSTRFLLLLLRLHASRRNNDPIGVNRLSCVTRLCASI